MKIRHLMLLAILIAKQAFCNPTTLIPETTTASQDTTTLISTTVITTTDNKNEDPNTTTISPTTITDQPTTTATTTATTTTTTTTLNPIDEACADQMYYEVADCNCHLDQCLSMIYDLNPDCPACALYEEPAPTTAFDWAKLFEGEPGTEENGNNTSITEAYPTTSQGNTETSMATAANTATEANTVTEANAGTETNTATTGEDTTTEAFSTTIITTTMKPALCNASVIQGVVFYKQGDLFSGKRCCCAPDFAGDSYFISFQTLNASWTRGYGDRNSKEFKDKVKFFNMELTNFIVDPGLGDKKVNFTVTGLKKGPENVIIVEGYLTVRQSHIDNVDKIGNLLKKAAITYFETGKNPKTFYNFDAIVLDRDFPEGLYEQPGATKDSLTGTKEGVSYGFLMVFLPIGLAAIILVFAYISTRPNVCLIRYWVK